MLGTLRPDGFPRISPVEPGLCEGQLWIVHLDITMWREGRGERTVRKWGRLSNRTNPGVVVL